MSGPVNAVEDAVAMAVTVGQAFLPVNAVEDDVVVQNRQRPMA